jgi:hypothetical protein
MDPLDKPLTISPIQMGWKISIELFINWQFWWIDDRNAEFSANLVLTCTWSQCFCPKPLPRPILTQLQWLWITIRLLTLLLEEMWCCLYHLKLLYYNGWNGHNLQWMYTTVVILQLTVSEYMYGSLGDKIFSIELNSTIASNIHWHLPCLRFCIAITFI